jgi:hypothetical protein
MCSCLPCSCPNSNNKDTSVKSYETGAGQIYPMKPEPVKYIFNFFHFSYLLNQTSIFYPQAPSQEHEGSRSKNAACRDDAPARRRFWRVAPTARWPGGGVLAISALARVAANRCRRRQHPSRGDDSRARQAHAGGVISRDDPLTLGPNGQIVRQPDYVDFTDYIYVSYDCKKPPGSRADQSLSRRGQMSNSAEPLQYEYEHYDPAIRAGDRSQWLHRAAFGAPSDR